MIGKALVALIVLFLLIAVFQSQFTAGIKGWRTNVTTENNVVVTGGGETGDNITLSYDLYQAATAEVTSVTSSNVTDSPVASAYVEATKSLEITGLVADTTRTITVVYFAETDDEVMQILGPFLGVLIFGALVAAIFWDLFSGRGKRRRRY